MDGISKRTLFKDLPQSAVVNLKLENVDYTVKTDKGIKTILKSVSGEFRAGELCAIMGPSGAGKSSLMNILAGFNLPKVKGRILVNSVERNMATFRKMSCYIMQSDELCPLLSVLEVMKLAANLKLGNCISTHEKQEMICEIIETIGLTHAGNTRTARLSGGEKKRLAIALELINNPPVLFFDEPTSGLDSTSCIQCVSLMKDLTRSGRTVICVIHQPSSSVFEMFDRLYLLAEGKCIYQGSTSDLVNFLSSSINLICPSHHNPADFAIDVASGKYGPVIDELNLAIKTFHGSGKHLPFVTKNTSDLNESLGSSTSHSISLEEIPSAFSGSAAATAGASFFMQFVLLFKKSMLCTVRDSTLTHIRISVHIIVGILVGCLYYGIGNEASKVLSNVGQVFFSQLFLMFTALMATVLTFPLEMPILAREHMNNWYTLKAFYLAKSTADLPFQIVYPAIYIVIVYFLTDQPFEVSRFFMYLTIGILMSCVAQSVGLLIGAACGIETAVFLGPVSMALLVLFSGFFVTFSTIPPYLRWICYTVYLRYGFEGSISALYDFDRPKLNCSDPFCQFRSPNKFLEALDIEKSIFWVDVAALIAFFFIIRVIAFLILWKKIRGRY